MRKLHIETTHNKSFVRELRFATSPQLHRYVFGETMKAVTLIPFICLLAVTGCANPLNRATSDNYSETCTIAEQNGRLDVAEEACYRALVNVDLGNLGLEMKSQKLYNLARIKRRLSKFSEAEALLKESLDIESKLDPVSEHRLGRRYVEMSVNLAGQDKWTEGVEYLDRVLDTTGRFSSQEISFTKLVLSKYAEHMRQAGDIDIANKYESVASTL